MQISVATLSRHNVGGVYVRNLWQRRDFREICPGACKNMYFQPREDRYSQLKNFSWKICWRTHWERISCAVIRNYILRGHSMLRKYCHIVSYKHFVGSDGRVVKFVRCLEETNSATWPKRRPEKTNTASSYIMLEAPRQAPFNAKAELVLN